MLRGFIDSARANRCNGVRIQLFDAYMTADDHAPFLQGQACSAFDDFLAPSEEIF